MGAAATVPCLVVAAPVRAAQSVHIEAETSFSDPVAPFTSDLEGCEGGTVENGAFVAPETPALGTFAGTKEFTCIEEGQVVGTFSVQLVAHFPVGPGSVGRWTVIDSSGSVEGLRASGSLVGFGEDNGILDVYDGTVHRA